MQYQYRTFVGTLSLNLQLKAYNNLTMYVSDPTTDTSPIAVDFYNISDRGPRYGPLGQLTPLSEPPGSGYFQCIDE